jgi:outer membrane protein OmpA-like peptidoglycan-associated protein
MPHHLPRLVLLATVAVLGTRLPAQAQTVQIFEQAPSLEQLRSIMIPESRGGASRRIVIPHPDMSASSPVQSAAVHVPAAVPFSAPPSEAAAMPVAPLSVAPMSVATSQAAPLPAPEAAAPQPAPRIAAQRASQRASRNAPQNAPQDAVAEAGIVGFRINFALDSAAVAPSYREFIDRIGALLKEEPQVKLRIEGHTDALGSDDYNLELSKRRAVAVAGYLVEQIGIDPDRLVVAGKGKSEPLTRDPFDPHNRRVQFVRVH